MIHINTYDTYKYKSKFIREKRAISNFKKYRFANLPIGPVGKAMYQKCLRRATKRPGFKSRTDPKNENHYSGF